MNISGKILSPFFHVTKQDTSFNDQDRQAAERLETVVRTVTKGCQLTLQNSRYEVLVPRLQAFDVELHGFAYEGVGVALAALDSFLPWKNRVQAFLEGPGKTYIYAVPLGAGMGLARLRRNPERFLSRLDPVYGWLILDGYGYHEGFFARRRYVDQKKLPSWISKEALHVFDNGIGRAIWFLSSTNVERVTETIASFPFSRQSDLWGGVGLACGYTGGVEREEYVRLKTLAGSSLLQLATGAALAAHARHLVGNPSTYVRLACEVLCGCSTEVAAQIVESARTDLPRDGREASYGMWRQRIANQLAALQSQETSAQA
jgi:hypothetical protein